MKIKVDIDNCIRDCGQVMVDLYNKKFGTSLTKADIIDYDMDISFPLLKRNGINAFDFFFNEHLYETFIKAPRMEGALGGLQLLKKLGHEIIIVSYQPSVAAKIETLRWLDKNGIPYDNIVFTNTQSKLVVDTDVIIDDHMKYLDEVPDTTTTVCIDWRYNRSKPYDYRFKSILHYAEYLFTKANDVDCSTDM